MHVGLLKVLVAVVLIAIAEMTAAIKDKQERLCFEITMAILMAGWIMRDGW